LARVTSESSCRALIDKAAARHGRLDILVNNAGTNIRKSPDTLSAASVRGRCRAPGRAARSTAAMT
jgi:NAD(P)-dependent dehydrogenase (short-subunit alcohol dehydrogenase family)